MRIRTSAVAGQFYPAEASALADSIRDCFLHGMGPGKLPPKSEGGRVVALLSPHAGYMYSGPVAAHGYYYCSSLRDIEVVIIAGPNHWALGSGVAVPESDAWQTPLGTIEIDRESAGQLGNECELIDVDDEAHAREHSIEVQVPFIQHIFKSAVKILPVSMALQDKSTSVELGEAIAKVARGKRALLIASSDLTHYEPHERAAKKDQELLKAVTEMDVTRHYTLIERLNITACGYGPVAAIMTAARRLGATDGQLLRYATSGDTSGDRSSVVGYASAIFT